MKLIISGLLTVLFFGISCRQEHPNVVFIYVDDMGWKDTGFMGSRYYETPNIDSLAGMGMVFTNGYASASNCAPSRASLMTGKWTPRHGIFTVGTAERGESRFRKLIPVENREILPEDLPALPRILGNAGYTTIHAGKWHLSEDPLDYGFDVNIGGGRAGHPQSYYPPYRNVKLEPDDGEYLTDLIMEKAIECVDTAREPFFLYYAPYAVHTPIQPVENLLEKYRNKPAADGQGYAEYATMVENLDRNIGLLMQSLKKSGNLNNTLILFTSDNGGLYGITRQPPLRAGKGSYYEGGIRVPFVLVWEGHIEPGTISDIPVTQIDIFPTVLEKALPGTEGYDYDGMSLWPVLEGAGTQTGTHAMTQSHGMSSGSGVRDGIHYVAETDAMTLSHGISFTSHGISFNDGISYGNIDAITLIDGINTRPLFWHFPIYLEAYSTGQHETRDPLFRTRPGSVIRLGEWKLHHYYEDDGLELYNLQQDPGERHNLAETQPGKAQELYQLLTEWRKSTGAPEPVELNPEFRLKPQE